MKRSNTLTEEDPAGSDSLEYLSWVPAETSVERVKGGSAEVAVVRTTGEACDDPGTPYFGIQLIVAGRADLECDLGRGRFRKEFGPGEFVIVPPDTDTKFSGPGTIEALSLAIPKKYVRDRLGEQDLHLLEGNNRLFAGPQNDARMATFMQLLWSEMNASRPNEHLFVDGVVQAVLATLLDMGDHPTVLTGPLRSPISKATMGEIRDFVRAAMHRPIRVEDLADVAGLSPAHFSQQFKQTTGATPFQYVVKERIERAKELMRQPNVRIVEVAHATGFCDQSHLTRQFKLQVGVTPAVFRQSKD